MSLTNLALNSVELFISLAKDFIALLDPDLVVFEVAPDQGHLSVLGIKVLVNVVGDVSKSGQLGVLFVSGILGA